MDAPKISAAAVVCLLECMILLLFCSRLSDPLSPLLANVFASKSMAKQNLERDGGAELRVGTVGFEQTN